MSLWSFLKVSPILIPFIIGIYKYEEIRKLKYLFFFVCFGVTTEIVNNVFKGFRFENILFLVHVYVLISFVFLCLFFQHVFKGYIKIIWFRGLMGSFLLLCFIELLFFQSIKDYPSLQFSVLAIVMVAFSILYYHKVMSEANMKSLSKEPLIWITTAMLIYYSGNLFYYILFNLFLDYSITYLSQIGRYYFPSINALFYLLIAIAFWKAGTQKS